MGKAFTKFALVIAVAGLPISGGAFVLSLAEEKPPPPTPRIVPQVPEHQKPTPPQSSEPEQEAAPEDLQGFIEPDTNREQDGGSNDWNDYGSCRAMVEAKGGIVSLVGGDPGDWIPEHPDWQWGAFSLRSRDVESLSYPGFGFFDSAEQGDFREQDIRSKTASFHCEPVPNT